LQPKRERNVTKNAIASLLPVFGHSFGLVNRWHSCSIPMGQQPLAPHP